MNTSVGVFKLHLFCYCLCSLLILRRLLLLLLFSDLSFFLSFFRSFMFSFQMCIYNRHRLSIFFFFFFFFENKNENVKFFSLLHLLCGLWDNVFRVSFFFFLLHSRLLLSLSLNHKINVNLTRRQCVKAVWWCTLFFFFFFCFSSLFCVCDVCHVM